MAGWQSVTINSIVGFGVANKWDKPTIDVVEEQLVVGTALGWLAWPSVTTNSIVGFGAVNKHRGFGRHPPKKASTNTKSKHKHKKTSTNTKRQA